MESGLLVCSSSLLVYLNRNLDLQGLVEVAVDREHAATCMY